MNTEKKQVQECCPEFYPEKWEKKNFKWEKKRFVKDKVRTFFFMPIGFGKTMQRVVNKMENAGVHSPDWLSLCDHTSRWNMDVYVEVDGEVPNADNVMMDGDFYSRVFEGPYNKTKEWCDHFESDVQAQGKKLNKMYMWYAYCPRCAKKYGKNYVAIIGEVENQ
jgi:hypothetical protein